MGLSVGWQDIYPWSFAGRWIDITDVTDGTYLLCVSADPVDRFRGALRAQQPGVGEAGP